MSDSTPCSVYLDTSDYSRFGDVLRGKADAHDERLYNELLELAAAGHAIFPCSAPMLAELFQYDPHHKDTTICKAEAVESLAGEYAFIYPSRLVALEVATAAHSAGLLNEGPTATAVSNDRYWQPNIGNVLGDLKENFKVQLASKLASSGHSRQVRRAAKTKMRKLTAADYAEAADAVVPQFARKWALSEEGVRRSIVAAFAGRVSTEDASRMMFAEIARPTTFIRAYFENYEGEKDLPFWMSKFGARMQEQAIKLRSALEEIPADLRPHVDAAFRADLAEKLGGIGSILVQAIETDELEFGVTEELVQRYARERTLSDSVPCCDTMNKMIMRFALESSDATAPGPQRSTGGDFIHALYANHADLWRGDRRFSHFLKEAVPTLASRIVSRLSDLPTRIRQFAGETKRPPLARGSHLDSASRRQRA